MKVQLVFINEFSEREAFEASSRGYLSHVLVKLDAGELFPVVFYDATRLKQDLDELASRGEKFVADPGMIILHEVTLEEMQAAVEELAARGYFSHLIPTTIERVRKAKGEWPPATS